MALPASGNRQLGAYTPPVDDYAFLMGEAFGEDLVARMLGHRRGLAGQQGLGEAGIGVE